MRETFGTILLVLLIVAAARPEKVGQTARQIADGLKQG